MSEIKHVLEEQLEREKNSALKQLTTSNLDAMYKITTTLCNLEKMEHGDIAETVMDAGENLIKKYSNGKYDKNIDALKMAEKNKKTFKMPHTFVIMMVIILFATLLTWIIPAGQYVRVENADGVKVVDPNQFSFIDLPAF